MLKRWVLALCVVLGVAVSVFVPHVLASRNSSGTYSLPSGNPVVSGTTITSTWANNTMSDISTELTSSLDRSGRGAMLAPLQCSNGSAAAPSLTYGSDQDTGFYRIGPNNMGLSLGGSKYIDFSTTTPLAVTGPGTFSGTLDVTGAVTGHAGATLTQSASNTSGLTTTGNGTGHGVAATGGATGNGVNGTGGATGGHGGLFLGTGTTGDGVNVTGKGSGQGVDATGGDSSGTGVDARGGAPNGIGLYAEGAGTGQAIRANGTAWLSGSNPSSSTGFTSSLTPTNIVKAWGQLTGTGGSWAVTSGFNITNVSCSSNTVYVDIVNDMSTANYLVLANGTTSTSNGTWIKGLPNAAGTVAIISYVWSAGGGGSIVTDNLCADSGAIYFMVLGAQ